MNNYFSIGEFAKLRNVNINSLLYYEKIGILKPAYVNPKTKYRYYSPDQLPLLDGIQMAVALGIPLKQLHEYVDEDGNMLNEKLLTDVHNLANQKIRSIETQLHSIDYNLGCIRKNEQYSGEEGFFIREFIQRRAIFAVVEDMDDRERIIESTKGIFQYAQERDLYPMLPGGVLVKEENGILELSLYFEIAYSGRPDEHILTIPGGTYSCLRVERDADEMNPLELIRNTYPQKEGLFVISNLYCGKYRLGSRPAEIQMYLHP